MADPDIRFDLNLTHADLRLALDDVFIQAGRAFIIDDVVEGEVSVHAADLSFRDALALLLPIDYEAVEINGLYHIRHQRQAAA